nr:unnamed protein product [Digitaria exilis]
MVSGIPRGLSNSPAFTIKDPPSWALLTTGPCRWKDDDSLLVAGSNSSTTAETHTSTGHRLRVSFDLAAPPARSLFYYNCTETTSDGKPAGLNIVAAHGDSVLLWMACRRSESASSSTSYVFDNFVYRSGCDTRRPSLTRLPDLKVFRRYESERSIRPLTSEDTGIMRRGGDGELVVARIDVLSEHCGGKGMANLCVLRPGSSSQWEDKRLLPILHEEGDEVMGPLTGPNMAISVGDRFLCWVEGHSSFIVCDMADDASTKLRHVALPGFPYDPHYYTNDLHPLEDAHNIGAAGTSAVRFVAVEPRCCCGGFGRCSCPRSRHAFTVTTWTLTLTMDEPIKWVKDTVLDCEELWALPGYEGIPRLHLKCPVVCLDNPDVIWFRVVSYEDEKAWMIQVDTRRKALLAAVIQTIGPFGSYNPYNPYFLRQAKLR